MIRETAVVITLGLCVAIILSAAAEAKTALTVTPTKLGLTFPQGKATKLTMTVSNAGDESSKVLSYPLDYIKRSNGNVELLPVGQSKWSCAKWIKVKPNKFGLEPRRTLAISRT